MPRPAAGGRIGVLLGAMTLAEKIGQLTMQTADMAISGPGGLTSEYLDAVRAGGVGSMLNLWGAGRVRELQRIAVEETRLGIPLLFGFDVVHGHRTVFPVPLAEAAAFDSDLWERTARAAALEAAADGLSLTFAPMLDVARDPRWGRIVEGPGEDPLVARRFAAAKVRGFQGGDLAAHGSIAATAKHLVGYGAALAGRDYAQADISERELREVYLPPFADAVAAGAAAIMPSFNDLAGVPMTAHRPLLRDLLRGQWGFDGVLISDYNAIAELVQHGVAADFAEAAALALEAGVDIDMMAGAYTQGLPAALERRRIDVALVDEAVLRVLALKERLGLLDDPFGRGVEPSPGPEKAHRALAREAARRSLVLLKNDADVLPLREGARLAVIGPLADAPGEMRGSWYGAGPAEETVSILQGLRAALPEGSLVHARGVAIDGEGPEDIAAAVAAARAADIVLLCLGEAAAMSGEAACRAEPGLPGRQEELAEAVLAAGRPVVLLLACGRPLVASRIIARSAAVLVTWFPGSEGGHAVAEVLRGRANPSGRLPVSWPVATGQIPIFFARRPTGRPADPELHYTSKYLDVPTEPLFPFGHGLSYGRFALEDLRCSAGEVAAGGRLDIEVDLANEGTVAGLQTVFLFIRDPVASVARPVLELKGWQTAWLEPGDRTTLRFELPADELAFLGPDLAPLLEEGGIEILAGPSADRSLLLSTSVRVAKDREH
ncbi:glycoside hydrolase family 3 N-terminal domain-containing protein [Geminicoccaceae bacterium 1502E]|nr:glycoside hydrolase family 3 N-terminal domain-containing protein [Geminicoccaceae bacterium 1502E]